MNKKDETIIRRIFHEAHVIDLDFSKWDLYLRLVVVGRAMPIADDGRFPVFNIDLCGVAELHWISNCLDIEYEKGHMQWTIIESDIQKEDQFIVLTLPTVGSGPEPTLKVKFKSIRITELSTKKIDEINPSWNRPYGPLARPSIEEIHSIIVSKELR